jgi:signal transduction histidine kinase
MPTPTPIPSDDAGPAPSWWKRLLGPARVLAAPLLLCALVLVALGHPLGTWLRGENTYDEASLQEWLEEARSFRETLPEMVEEYFGRLRLYAQVRARPVPNDPEEAGRLTLQQLWAAQNVALKRAEIREHLRTLGAPVTKRYSGQLPLFPIIYRLQVRFHLDGEMVQAEAVPASEMERPGDPITWDSGLPSDSSQYQEMEHSIHPQASVYVRYQLHAYNKRQRIEQEHDQRIRQLGALAVAGTLLAILWMVLAQRRERERELQQLRAQQQINQAERMLLQEEHRHAETERQLLEQRLATQAAEQRALELKSQLYASIGIMAGSYAHNIKNLLVRPNDLLRRCLENDGLSPDQALMLHEVQETLATVTERLQQILHTVRRDPSRAEETVLDLNAVVSELEATWRDLAREKWKLDIVVQQNVEGTSGLDEPLWISGDVSHLQQAVENLLFNARDATFEMRNHMRDSARREQTLDVAARRQAIIAAAGWRGRAILRTLRRGGEVVLEVCDNGAGMAEEVRRRCTETHFTTKRDNAIYEGHSTGMGLGLSFVLAILDHHRAHLEIESAPLQGAVFRIRFPAPQRVAASV